MHYHITDDTDLSMTEKRRIFLTDLGHPADTQNINDTTQFFNVHTLNYSGIKFVANMCMMQNIFTKIHEEDCE